MEQLIKEEPRKSGSTIAEMFVGGSYDGEEISQVAAKGNDFIIFKCKGDPGVRYRYTDKAFSADIARLEQVMHKAHTKFKGELIRDFNALEASAARSIFQRSEKNEIDKRIAVIQEEIDKLPAIKHVIGSGPNYCIWQNAEGALGFRNTDPTPEHERAISEFSRVQSLSADLLPKGARSSFNGRLAAALHASFKLNSDCKDTFATLEKLVIAAMQNEVKVKILVITFGVAVTLIFLAIWAYYFLALPDFIRLSMVSATGGLAGALISFLERSKASNIGEGDLAIFLILSNVCRVLIGGIFGVIAFAASNADLAFSLFKSSKTALLILGIAAGFSERLIPDVLGTIASSKTNTSEDEN